jgi:mannose-1-phosphate guanylyltransferase
MSEALNRYSAAIGTESEAQARRELYEHAEDISVDVAVLERADNVIVVKGEIAWDDIGSWLALERINPRDREYNVTIGETLLHDSYEVTAVNAGDGIVCTFGVSDIVVISTKSVVLVAHKTKVGDLKRLIARLSECEEYEKYL